jgi:uncharacterized membrane protein
MTRNQNMSAKFRAALKGELPAWLQEGIVSEQTAKQLAEKYQLHNLQAESSSLLTAVIFTIGSLLLGGGLITFVAANWEDISAPVKLAILFSALLAFHLAGYWLWHRRGWSRLGHALIFCGCLVFGANIGLIAQIFHIRGSWYGAFGAWAIGALVMAWAVRSWIVGLLVVFTSFLWLTGYHNDGNEQASMAYPIVLAAALIPLAVLARSRVLYAATFLGIIISTCVMAGFGDSARPMLLALAAGGFLACTVGELHRLTNWHSEFANLTAGLGFSVLALAAYIGSFDDVWDSPTRADRRFPYLAILLLALSIVASVFWLQREAKERLWIPIALMAIAAQLCGSALLAITTTNDAGILFTFLTNIAALMLAAVIIGISLIDEKRAAFWLGSLYIILLILSRFLEYETSLLLKSAAFLACGVAVIIAGISYEKYLRRKASQLEIGDPKGMAYE